jgi:hypothetical protein
MERESVKVSNFQAHVFEYVTGVLWVVVLLVFALGKRNAASLLQDTADILKPIADLKLSDILTGFFIAITGVVLPYALAMALRPIAIWPMNGLLRLGRWIQRRLFRKSRRDLHRLAVSRLHGTLSISSDTDYPELLAIITARDLGIAETVEWLRNEVTFRAASVLPSAILFGLIAYRMSSTHQLLFAWGTGLVVFASGAAYAIQMLAYWRDRAESLVVLFTASPPGTQHVATGALTSAVPKPPQSEIVVPSSASHTELSSVEVIETSVTTTTIEIHGKDGAG